MARRSESLGEILWRGVFALLAICVLYWATSSGFLQDRIVTPVMSKAFEKQVGKDASKQAASYIEKLRVAPECAEFEEMLTEAGKGSPIDRQTIKTLSEVFAAAKERGCTTEGKASRGEQLRAQFPASGSVEYLRQVTAEEFQAELTVGAPGKPSTSLYELRFTEKKYGVPLMVVYVSGGQSHKMGLPPGAYSVVVEGGTQWYGAEQRFGGSRALRYETVVAVAKDGKTSVMVER